MVSMGGRMPNKAKPDKIVVPKAEGQNGYKKCPGCGHTFFHLPCKEWGEVTDFKCQYCEEEAEDRKKNPWRYEVHVHRCEYCKCQDCYGGCDSEGEYYRYQEAEAERERERRASEEW